MAKLNSEKRQNYALTTKISLVGSTPGLIICNFDWLATGPIAGVLGYLG